ncbi:MAG: hypothetical protein AAGK14_08325 [Verrucomicrobiota bacterium]
MATNRLPAGIWVIGILGCLAGGWNALAGSFASGVALMTPPPSDPQGDLTLTQVPEMKVILPLTALWGWLILISSLGLLRRKPWGRIGILALTALTLIGFLGFVLTLSLAYDLPTIGLVSGSIGGILFLGIPCALIFWYLNRTQIKEYYR